jgi:hypothetical protein
MTFIVHEYHLLAQSEPLASAPTMQQVTAG